MAQKVSCTQCGEKPAIMQYEGGHLLCVDCNLKFVQAYQIKQNESARILNHLYEMAEARIGLSGVLPRIDTSQPMAHSGPLHLNNITVKDSVVGVVNTGELAKLDVAMTNVRAGGDDKLAAQLAQITQAVLNAEDMNKGDQAEALEALKPSTT